MSPTLAKGFSKLRQPGYFILLDDLTFRYFTSTNKDVVVDMKLVSRYVGKLQPSGIPLTKNSPYTKLFDLGIKKGMEGGVLRMIQSKWLGAVPKSNQGAAQAISYKKLGTLFIFLSISIFIAVIVSVFEFIIYLLH